MPGLAAAQVLCRHHEAPSCVQAQLELVRTAPGTAAASLRRPQAHADTVGGEELRCGRGRGELNGGCQRSGYDRCARCSAVCRRGSKRSHGPSPARIWTAIRHVGVRHPSESGWPERRCWDPSSSWHIGFARRPHSDLSAQWPGRRDSGHDTSPATLSIVQRVLPHSNLAITH